MASVFSALAEADEENRQIRADDANFYKQFFYYFELRVPTNILPPGVTQGTFFFPLALAPEQIRMSEPFSVEVTQTLDAGLYVEEDGIVMRTIRLSGHTGFRPRPLPDTGVTSLNALSPDRRSFSRKLIANIVFSISGQRHFQYLQDAVFRVYGDLKKDPATAEDTMLLFHNPRDQESWVVVPQTFDGDRNVAERVLYRYDIELLAVEAGSQVRKFQNEEAGLLQKLAKGVEMVQGGIQKAAGAMRDVVALTDQLENAVKGFATIIDDVGSIIRAATDFVEGVTEFIEIPYTFIASTANAIDDALGLLSQIEESGNRIAVVPDTVEQKFRQMGDALDMMFHAELYNPSLKKQLQLYRDEQELLTSVPRSRLDAAEASGSPTSFREVEALGTSITAGDVESARGELGVGRGATRYSGATRVRLTKGDTLPGLAARYLGDARQWQAIAVLNGLQPPFLQESVNLEPSVEARGLPGVLGIGDEILIPTLTVPPSDLPSPPTLGVVPDEDAEVHLMGVDWALKAIGGRPGARIYDLALDTAGGSVDAKRVRGRDNLTQGMTTRMETEKGTDPMYHQMGLSRVVGSPNLAITNREAVRIKMIESLLQDPRINAVRRLDLTGSALDVLAAEYEVEPRGFTQPTQGRVIL